MAGQRLPLPHSCLAIPDREPHHWGHGQTVTVLGGGLGGTGFGGVGSLPAGGLGFLGGGAFGGGAFGGWSVSVTSTNVSPIWIGIGDALVVRLDTGTVPRLLLSPVS